MAFHTMHSKTFAVLLLLLAGAGEARAESIALSVSAEAGAPPLTLPHQHALAFPGEHSFHLAPPRAADKKDAGKVKIGRAHV